MSMKCWAWILNPWILPNLWLSPIFVSDSPLQCLDSLRKIGYLLSFNCNSSTFLTSEQIQICFLENSDFFLKKYMLTYSIYSNNTFYNYIFYTMPDSTIVWMLCLSMFGTTKVLQARCHKSLYWALVIEPNN